MVSLPKSTPASRVDLLELVVGLKVPSSLAALHHGTFAEVGMWPPRWLCSCGRCAGASSRPAYSSGDADVDEVLDAPIAATTSSRKARMLRVLLLRRVGGRRAVDDVVGQLAAVELPLLAAAVEQPDVLVAVELEVPVGVRGEPVVVAAVEHDGVVVGDALLDSSASNCALLTKSRRTWSWRSVVQSSLHGALDVALVVGGWCPRRPRRARSRVVERAPRPSQRPPGRRYGSCG